MHSGVSNSLKLETPETMNAEKVFWILQLRSGEIVTPMNSMKQFQSSKSYSLNPSSQHGDYPGQEVPRGADVALKLAVSACSTDRIEM